jgi:hypothetical protein
VVHKPHLLGGPGYHLPQGACDVLSPAERVSARWWEGEIPCRERVFADWLKFDRWLRDLVEASRPAQARRRGWRRLRG